MIHDNDANEPTHIGELVSNVMRRAKLVDALQTAKIRYSLLKRRFEYRGAPFDQSLWEQVEDARREVDELERQVAECSIH